MSKPLLHDADRQAADDVDDDDRPCAAIASPLTNLLAPSIDAVEVGLALDRAAPGAGVVRGDQAGVEVGVDRSSACRASRRG